MRSLGMIRSINYPLPGQAIGWPGEPVLNADHLLAKSDHFILNVMANVSAAKPGNAAERAPMFDQCNFIQQEGRIIVGHLGAPAKPDPGNLTDFGIAGEVKQAAVNPVHIFGNLFNHQDMPGKIRLQGCAKQLAQHRQVECSLRHSGRQAP